MWTYEQGQVHETSCVSFVGVKDGEERVAFLEPFPGRYRFKSDSSGKYLVETEPETGERLVRLAWHKKRYVRGAALEASSVMEAREEPPNQATNVEAWLAGVRDGLYESVLVRGLPERMKEVWQGEYQPDRSFPDRGAPDHTAGSSRPPRAPHPRGGCR